MHLSILHLRTPFVPLKIFIVLHCALGHEGASGKQRQPNGDA